MRRGEDAGEQEAAEQRHDDGCGDEPDCGGHREPPSLRSARGDDGVEDGEIIDRAHVTHQVFELARQLALEGGHLIHR